MLRRRDTDTDVYGSRLRGALSVPAWFLRALIWKGQERIVWPLADFSRGAFEVLAGPRQAIALAVEERLIWPLSDRVALWGYPRRAAGAAALVTFAAGAAALGILLGAQGDPAKPLAPAVRVALAEPQPKVAEEQQPSGPTLKGAPPVFAVEDGAEVGGAADGTEEASSVGGGAEGSSETDLGPGESTGAEDAATSSDAPVPAGPVAMKVARRFAEAFVFYEVGERADRAETVFSETATPRLANALSARPPRLPEEVKVPQARVLNLVPGPRRAKTYTVSVSLLRTGSISELRLKMQKQNGAWVVTDVRG